LKNTIPPFDPFILQLLDQIRSVAPNQVPIYLVGGAVRDHLLGKEIKDLDFVLDGNTASISLAVKRILKARSFILDDNRQTARVIHKLPNGENILLDFVKLTGFSLIEDLQNRDFTINAMAVELSQPGFLLDPLNGRSDLAQGILKTCSENSMQDDPLRVLRGIRIALNYGLQIDDASSQLMTETAPSLACISGERLRDELFIILALSQPDKALRMMDRFNCLLPILPELELLKSVPVSAPHVHGLWDHTLQVAVYLNALLDAILQNEQNIILSYPFASQLIERIWSFQPELKKYLINDIQQERSRKNLLLFSALYHDTGKPETMQLGKDRRLHFRGHAKESLLAVTNRTIALALSNHEIELISTVVANHMRIHDLANSPNAPSSKAIYRYFRDCSEYGIDICLLSLADMWATYEHTLSKDQWIRELDVVRSLLHAFWFQTSEVVNPPKLLSGDDLRDVFGLTPGPIYAEILDALKEEQAGMNLRTREEALAFVQTILQKKGVNPGKK
jgi:poly(A) polymerase